MTSSRGSAAKIRTALVGLCLAAGLMGGCSNSTSWSPTRHAMTRAEANTLLRQQAVARRDADANRSLVLADDQSSRMTEPASLSSASSRTATASVPTGE